jgi:hypothetical protein
MNANTLNFEEMRALVDSDEDCDVSVVGANGNWRIFIHTHANVRALSRPSEGLAAAFATLTDVELELRELGVVHFEVACNGSDSPMDAPFTEVDPEYNAWFRAQVQEALDDPSPPIPHEEAMRQIRAALKLS